MMDEDTYKKIMEIVREFDKLADQIGGTIKGERKRVCTCKDNSDCKSSNRSCVCNNNNNGTN